jgi:ornithine carbamoyltransferase
MSGKTGVLIFEKPSLRTRITFETAINELGGYSINLDAQMVRMGERESVEDVARNLERWVHLIVARTYSHRTLLQLRDHCSAPVINALSDVEHPCQALAFGLTLQERFGDEPAHVVFVGDGNNVCNAIMILCAKLGYPFTLACPSGYEPPVSLIASCREIARQGGADVTILSDPAAALVDASVVYTDVWVSMGQEREAEERKRRFSPFQVNASLLAKASRELLVSHCLPAHRGEEITSEVLDSPRSIALDEAENRLHVQKAVITHLFT